MPAPVRNSVCRSLTSSSGGKRPSLPALAFVAPLVAAAAKSVNAGAEDGRRGAGSARLDAAQLLAVEPPRRHPLGAGRRAGGWGRWVVQRNAARLQPLCLFAIAGRDELGAGR